MDFYEKISVAKEYYDAGNFVAALTLLDEIKQVEPSARAVIRLEAAIYFKQNRFLKAFLLSKEFLPTFDLNDPEEKLSAIQTLNRLGVICSLLGLPEEAMDFCRLSAQMHTDNRKSADDFSNVIFDANSLDNFSRADFDKLYTEYKNYLSDIVPFAPKVYNHKKIRVGFLSGDFYGHVAMRWGGNLITELDKNFFDTYIYSSVGKTGDIVTNFLRSTAHAWRDIGNLSDEEAAKVIRDDEIDILFDLSGHTAGNRLRVAAYRPATVQISGIGYMNSTGLDCFDYFLSDVHCAGDESWFVEKLIRLPQTHFTYLPPPEEKIFAEPPCLRNGYVTFGCFNNFAKVTDRMLSAWKKILDLVPNSRLLFKHKVFSWPEDRKFVAERLTALGFDVDRVDMRSHSLDYLKQYNDVDIALDTFPYTGGITTCEAFWMGVPVVSLYGNRHGTRFGLSMLTNVGLEELAVDNIDEYISRAVMLANDFDLLTLLRQNLRGMMKNSPLMDAKTYIREVEKVFAQILVDKQKNYRANS